MCWKAHLEACIIKYKKYEKKLRPRQRAEQEGWASSVRYIVNSDLCEEAWEVYSTFNEWGEEGDEHTLPIQDYIFKIN